MRSWTRSERFGALTNPKSPSPQSQRPGSPTRLMHRIWAVQRERRDIHVEVLAAARHHLIGAAHHAGPRLEQAARRVLERLAGRQIRLFAYHAFAHDILGV